MRSIVAVRLGVLVTVVSHLFAMYLSGADASSTPISQLSRGTTGWIPTLGLLSLALAWAVLVPKLWIGNSRTSWRSGSFLLAISVPTLLYVAYYFASASDAQLFGPNANDPLSVLASVIGVAMAALLPGLRDRGLALARLNLLVLLVWIGLVPVIPLVEPSWLGAYERVVGSLLLFWTFLLSFSLDDGPTKASRQ